MYSYLTLLMRIKGAPIRFYMTLAFQQIGRSILIPISTISVKPVTKKLLGYALGNLWDASCKFLSYTC